MKSLKVTNFKTKNKTFEPLQPKTSTLKIKVRVETNENTLH